MSSHTRFPKSDELVEISRYYGKNPEYVLAGGGNTSFKNREHLWIKASGFPLATITEEGFAKVNRKCLNKISAGTYSTDPIKREAEIKEALHHCTLDKNKRPSVETSLHNLIGYAFVVHTHPVLVNGLMCAKEAANETRNLFGRDALFFPYTNPGYTLFKCLEQKLQKYRQNRNFEPGIIFLENHGVVVSAGTTQEIRDRYQDIESTIRNRMHQDIPSSELTAAKLSDYTGQLNRLPGITAKAYHSELIRKFIHSRAAFAQVDTAYTPDVVVYCKARFLYLETGPEDVIREIRKFETTHGYYPRVIGVKEKGIICMEEDEKAVSTVFEVFQDMLKISSVAESFRGAKALTKKQIAFIDNWEVENYRRQIAKKG